MKVLTVLVPTYNVEKYLRRCLDSLLLPEVLEEIEVLVVNDGSKDGSADIARAYEKKYPQTVVFVDKERRTWFYDQCRNRESTGNLFQSAGQ